MFELDSKALEEKVARAICGPSADEEYRGKDALMPDGTGIPRWELYRGMAKIAIATLSALPAPATQEVDELREINVQNPLLILAGIKQFGLAPDRSDLRDLEAAVIRLHEDTARLDWLEIQYLYVATYSNPSDDFEAGSNVRGNTSDLRAQIDRARAAEKDKG